MEGGGHNKAGTVTQPTSLGLGNCVTTCYDTGRKTTKLAHIAHSGANTY